MRVGKRLVSLGLISSYDERANLQSYPKLYKFSPIPRLQDFKINNKKASWETRYYDLDLMQSGRQDSNLRPSAPKALNNPSRTLCLQAITK